MAVHLTAQQWRTKNFADVKISLHDAGETHVVDSVASVPMEFG